MEENDSDNYYEKVIVRNFNIEDEGYINQINEA